MKYFIRLFFCIPLLLNAQHKTIIFDCEHTPIKLNFATVNFDLNSLLGVSSNINFQFVRQKTTLLKSQTENHYSFQQFYNTYPIEGAEIVLHYRDSVLFYINGTYIDSLPNSIPSISIAETDAFQTMQVTEGTKQFFWDSTNTKTHGLEKITELQPWLSKPTGNLVLKFIKGTNTY